MFPAALATFNASPERYRNHACANCGAGYTMEPIGGVAARPSIRRRPSAECQRDWRTSNTIGYTTPPIPTISQNQSDSWTRTQRSASRESATRK